MSRYTITVSAQGRSDPEAIIGYDPPLRTLFLQAFPHEVTDDPALWLGTYDQEFQTIATLHAATLAEGYDFKPLPEHIAEHLAHDKEQESDRPPHDGPLAALLRPLRSE